MHRDISNILESVVLHRIARCWSLQMSCLCYQPQASMDTAAGGESDRLGSILDIALMSYTKRHR
jgi:hypothetical protein